MLRDLKPYDEYRKIGLPWLKLVPAHWSVERAKNLVRAIDVRSAEGQEELLTVSSARGVVPRSSASVTMFQAVSYVGHKLCWPGDLVINSLWAWGRGLGVSHYHGIVSTAYGVYRPREGQSIEADYLDLLARSDPFQWELQVRSRGVWKSRLQLTDDQFLAAPLPVPPTAEQRAIVKYLGHAHARIDRAIAAKRKLITLLEEQKQAIINQAVTRGLDPTAPMKDSGVPWLGWMPEPWLHSTVGRLQVLVTSGSRGWAEYYSEAGPLFIQSGNLGREMSLDLSQVQRVALPGTVEGLRTAVSRDDVLICITGALTGNVVHVSESLASPAYINQHVALIRLRPGVVDARFFAYSLRARAGQEQFKVSEYGGTKQGLGLSEVRGVRLPLPPLGEQRVIVEYLDERLATAARATSHARHEIELLREFRIRLTSDVVTGRLDVREGAAALPALVEPLSVDVGSDGDESLDDLEDSREEVDA